MNDGLSRVNRIRYDTPSYSGIHAAVSIGQGSATELGFAYKGSVGETKVDARAFVADADDFANNAEIAGFSASALHSSRFNVTIAFSDRNSDTGDDQDATTLKLVYKTGIHAPSVDFGSGDTGDDNADTFGLTYAAVPADGFEVFAMYRQLDADISGAESVDLVAFGSRVKF